MASKACGRWEVNGRQRVCCEQNVCPACASARGLARVVDGSGTGVCAFGRPVLGRAPPPMWGVGGLGDVLAAGARRSAGLVRAPDGPDRSSPASAAL